MVRIETVFLALLALAFWGVFAGSLADAPGISAVIFLPTLLATGAAITSGRDNLREDS